MMSTTSSSGHNDADAAAPEDLTDVSYTADGTVIAFAERAEDQSYSQSGIEVELKHVVTRVSVVTTVPTDIDGTHTLTVSVPRCYTAYDVSEMQPLTESGKTDFAYTAFRSAQADEQMGHFYLLGDGRTATLTLKYTANGTTNTAEASNVPLNPDYHITLKGAVPNIGLADVTITTGEKDIIGYTFDGSTYTVYNAEGLQAWAEAAKSNPALNCTLAEDIDLTGFNWTPIGDNNNKYTGTFDGGDHTITGLTVTTSDQYAGLFGYLSGTVKDVTLKDVYAGGVVGNNGGFSTLQACYAWGSVTGSGSVYVGGVTGSNDSSTLQACYHAKGAVSGPNGTTGGVAGRNFKDSMFGGGIITACYWGGNGQEQGIGENQAGTTGGTEQVTDGNWSGAKDAMNTALENTVWYYKPYNDGLPVLARTI